MVDPPDSQELPMEFQLHTLPEEYTKLLVEHRTDLGDCTTGPVEHMFEAER